MINTAILGSRMHYAVPKTFYRAGLLNQHYTDFSIPAEKTQLYSTFSPKFASRNCSLPSSHLITYTALSFKARFKRYFGKNTDITRNILSTEINKNFTELCIKSGILDTEVIYAMKGAALEIFQKSAHNLKILEQALVTKNTEIQNIRTYLEKYSIDDNGWNSSQYEMIHQRNIEEIKLADIIIAPSQFVKNDVLKYVPNANIKVVPYGVDIKRSPVDSIKSSNKTILTVGEVGLRKGSMIVWAAARKYPQLRFEMVGPINLPKKLLALKPENVILFGSVAKNKVIQHFQSCGAFLLPSLAEGSATVIYEALACGVPVICSEQCGSVINHKEDGWLFDISDFDNMCLGIEAFMNPETKHEISNNALMRSHEYTVKKYGERLLAHIGKKKS